MPGEYHTHGTSEDGEVAGEDGKSVPWTSPKFILLMAIGISCFCVGVWQIVQVITGGGPFDYGKFMRISSATHLAILSPIVCIQGYYIVKSSILRDHIIRLEDEVVRRSAVVEALTIQEEYLQAETDKLDDYYEALTEFMEQQNLEFDELMHLINESKFIASKTRNIALMIRLEEIVNIIIEADSNYDFKVQGKEIENMIKRLKKYDDLNLDLETITESIIKSDGDIRTAISLVYQMMPNENDEEYTIYEDANDTSCGDDTTTSSEKNNRPSYEEVSPRPKWKKMEERSSYLGCSQKLLTLPTIDFLKDNPAEMTRGRRIALYLMKYQFYYPTPRFQLESKSKLGNAIESKFEDNPTVKSESEKLIIMSSENTTANLEKAWAFFEHNTLPRYKLKAKPDNWKKPHSLKRIKNKISKADKQLNKADPSEQYSKTRLYSPFYTPLKQMGDFGIGVGLYFSTLRFLSIVTLLAGLLNIPAIQYFLSEKYSDGQSGLNFWLKGSAICTRTKWVICDTCNIHDGRPEYISESRLAQGIGTSTLTGKQTEIILALKNDCPQPDVFLGIVYFATLLFLILGIIVMDIFQKNMEVKFNEDEQTASDYSVIVKNPPINAKNPTEWKRFFETRFTDVHVTCCTVGINNHQLLATLVERRELRQRIRFKLPHGSKLDNHSLEQVAVQIRNNRTFIQQKLSKVFPGVPEMFSRIKVLESSIFTLAKSQYDATSVFVSFETEAAQRKVLASMINGEYIFSDDHRIYIKKAIEPSSIRWQYLDVQYWDQVKKIILTSIATFVGLILVSVIGVTMRKRKLMYAAFVIAMSNEGFPIFALFLTNFEKHASRDSLEISLYIKIIIFRWTNTAFVTAIASDFTETLQPNGLVSNVFLIFFAEILISNIYQLLDLFGNFKRHILAPRAQTQEQMNSYMMGEDYYIAERYTNVTKILFLALWYSTVYPATFFLATIAFIINYFSDRFSLMRSWKQIGTIGSTISLISRRCFCTLAIFGLAIHGSYLWSSFPFDNLCMTNFNSTETPEERLIVGDIVNRKNLKDRRYEIDPADFLRDENGKQKTLTFENSDKVYKFCDQDMMRYTDSFPPFPQYQKDAWMTNDQEVISFILSVMTLVIIVIVCGNSCVLFGKKVLGYEYSPQFDARDQGIAFSDGNLFGGGYIPEVKSREMQYPLIACNIETFCHDLFEWHDQEKPYEYYDLTEDVRSIFRERKERIDTSSIFSRVSHTPPRDVNIENMRF